MFVRQSAIFECVQRKGTILLLRSIDNMMSVRQFSSLVEHNSSATNCLDHHPTHPASLCEPVNSLELDRDLERGLSWKQGIHFVLSGRLCQRRDFNPLYYQSFAAFCKVPTVHYLPKDLEQHNLAHDIQHLTRVALGKLLFPISLSSSPPRRNGSQAATLIHTQVASSLGLRHLQLSQCDHLFDAARYRHHSSYSSLALYSSRCSGKSPQMLPPTN